MEGARRARSADLPTIVGLARAARSAIAEARGGLQLLAHDLRPEPLEAWLAPAVDGDEPLVWVGTIDDVVVGYAVARFDRDDVPSRAVLEELYVEPGARGVGVGEVVLEAVIEASRAEGCAGLDSVALPGDRDTKNFFETFGLTARAITVHRDL